VAGGCTAVAGTDVVLPACSLPEPGRTASEGKLADVVAGAIWPVNLPSGVRCLAVNIEERDDAPWQMTC